MKDNVKCELVYDVVDQSLVDEIEREIEEAIADSLVRMEQDGNTLIATGLETGLQVEGTIEGDQIRSEDEIEYPSIETECAVETEGTAFSADSVSATETAGCTHPDFGFVSVCTYQLERVP